MTLTTINLEASSYTIGIEGISVVWATCKDENNNIIDCPIPNLTWSSDPLLKVRLEPNPTIASCFVYGKSSGNVNITANVDNIKSNILTIAVIGPSLQFIEINPKSINIGIGQSLSFNAVCKDQYNYIIDCPILTWDSSNPLVCSIDQNGLLKGLSIGNTKITAFAENKTSNIASVVVSPTDFGGLMVFSSFAIGIVYLILT